MSVKLREKMLTNGLVSFYLDIYHNKKRWYEFLLIKVNRKKPSNEDKEKRRLVLEIRSKREHELIVEDNGLIDRKRKLADFITFFEQYINSKISNQQFKTTLSQLREFVGNQHLAINGVTTEWMKDFERHLLISVSHNTALCYRKNINGALNELVRKQVIPRNPWHAVPKHDRLKKKDIIRTAWTLEQLQLLASTPCDIKHQFRQAYFFACFTGLRWSDVNGLKWTNVIEKTINEREEWFIYFEQQKTEFVEYFPLSDQAVEILKVQKAMIDNCSSIYVFPLVKETDRKNKPVQSRVDYALKKWAKAAGLDEKK